MSTFLMSFGGLFWAFALFLLYKAFGRDVFAAAATVHFFTAGAVLVGSGAIVRAIDRQKAK